MARRRRNVTTGKNSLAGKLQKKNFKKKTLLNLEVNGERNNMTFPRFNWR